MIKLHTILGLCMLLGAAVSQLQPQYLTQLQAQQLQAKHLQAHQLQAKQLQAQHALRTSPMAMMRLRGHMMPSRPRWAYAASNQIPMFAQRQFKPYYQMKGPPFFYRSQKPYMKSPYPFWKAPANYRPLSGNEQFRSPPVQQPTPLASQTHQVPSSAQKILSASPPIKNLLIGNTQTKNVFSPSAPIPNTLTTPTYNIPQTHGPSYTSQSIAGPVTAVPVRVDSERGVIHTIPAPNLGSSLLSNYRTQLQSQSSNQFLPYKVASSHSYEVTEATTEKINQYNPQNQVYAAQSASKNSPSAHYFSTGLQGQYVPQVSSVKAQGLTPALSNQHQVTTFLNPISHSSGAYALPLIQEAPLQHHFTVQHYYDKGKSQLYSLDSKVQAFKPVPKSVEKLQEQFLKNTKSTSPNLHSLNKQNYDSEKFKQSTQEVKLNDQYHKTVVRNTQEGVQVNHFIGNDTKKNIDSEVQSSIAVNSKFLPMNVPSAKMNESFIAAYLAEIDSIATNSMSANSFRPTPATITKVDELFSNNPNPYLIQNAAPQISKPVFTQEYSNFIPSQGVSFDVTEDNQSVNHAPIRIFVPEYEDEHEQQPSENIQVSASINTGEPSKNDMTIIFENDSHEHHDIINVSNSTLAKEANDVTTEVITRPNNDVLVSVPQNVTNPTLDILTKDWKTSIIIKPKSNNKDANSDLNEIGEFGNRIKPKSN